MPTIFPLRLAWAWREKLPARGRSSNASLKKEVQNKIIIFIIRFLESAKAKLRQPRNRYQQAADRPRKMYASVDINKQADKTTIIIRPRKPLIFKLGLAVTLITLVPGLLLALGLIISGHIRKSVEIWATLGLVLILTIFVYKHLRQAFRKEILTVEKNKLTYNNSFLGLGKYFETNLNKLKTFKYVGYSQNTKHPLEIKGDALGFGTQEGEINYLNQDGTMLLATEFDVLKFGVDVDEEDYLKIKRIID